MNVTRHDRWLYRTMNDPRTRRAHATRARRRFFVASHMALTAVTATGAVLLFLSDEPWWSAAVLVPMVAWIPVTGVLNASTRGLLELRSRALDERQLAERGEVHTRAHRLTLGAMTTALLGFFVAAMLFDVPFHDLSVPLAVTSFAVLLLHWLAPLWVAVLRVPDEVDEDEEYEGFQGATA
ncbi:hypothetical protein ACWGJ2_27305 [Streptomyces sp. NPDC054796]